MSRESPSRIILRILREDDRELASSTSSGSVVKSFLGPRMKDIMMINGFLSRVTVIHQKVLIQNN